MLTTATADGSLRSRPMITRQAGEDGLWFLTHSRDSKVDEAMLNPNVNVSYSDPSRNRFVSVTGTAALVRDREEVRRMWDDGALMCFPLGPDDPELALLRVSVERAEYWDAPAGDPATLVFEDIKIDLRDEG